MGSRPRPVTTDVRALLLHGTDGHPRENWFPWARTQIEALGMVVDVPALPTPIGHSLDNWISAFLSQAETRRYDLCVAHSLGTAFALRLLESRTVRIGTFVSVAGCIGRTHVPRFDDLNKSFLAGPFDWPLIRGALGTSVVVYSDDDPYIDIGQSKQLVENLGATAIVLHAAGHINAAAGYLDLDVLGPVFNAVRDRDAAKAGAS